MRSLPLLLLTALALLVTVTLVSAKPKPTVNAAIAAGGGSGGLSGGNSGNVDGGDSLATNNDTDLSDPPGNWITGDLNASAPIFTTVSVNKIGSINQVDGTFWFDFYIYIAWRDDRQIENAGSSFDANDPKVWFPKPELINKNSEDSESDWFCYWQEADKVPVFMEKEVKIQEGKNGVWSLCQVRRQVTLDADLLLKDFPFDTQNANIIIESLDKVEDQMHYLLVKGIEDGLIPPQGKEGVSGWTILDTHATTSSHSYSMFGEVYSQLKLSLVLQRQPAYYVTRYVWGVVFLVAMALLVLFVPGDVPDRLGFVQSSFLGIVSWQFILVTSAPVTGYNTRLDNFMVVSMVVVFIAYVWNSVRTALAPSLPRISHVARGYMAVRCASGFTPGWTTRTPSTMRVLALLLARRMQAPRVPSRTWTCSPTRPAKSRRTSRHHRC